jgi:hypothetical protein
LIADAVGGDDEMGGHDGGTEMAAPAATEGHAGEPGHSGDETLGAPTDYDVPGLAVADNGLALDLQQSELPSAERTELAFRIIGPDGAAVADFDVEHDRRMHLIVVRRDLTGFQHLHPRMDPDGTWSTPISLQNAGVYRVFADFTHDGEDTTLGADLLVNGEAEYVDLPRESASANTGTGYSVRLESGTSVAGTEDELAFTVERDGEPVDVEPYLGADGHLVALREGDLGFLHVHPVEGGAPGEPIRFMTEFPTQGRYRLYLQFKHRGEVHTAEFTRAAGG